MKLSISQEKGLIRRKYEHWASFLGSRNRLSKARENPFPGGYGLSLLVREFDLTHEDNKRLITATQICSSTISFGPRKPIVTWPKPRWNSGLESSQVRKHVGISDLMGVNSENTSEFRTWWESIPKIHRNFGLEGDQVRNSDMFSDLIPIKPEIPTCFQTLAASSPKFQRVFGLDSDQVRKHVALPDFRMQEVQIPNKFGCQTFFEEYKAIQVLYQRSMKT